MKTRIKRASRLAWALMSMVGLCLGQSPLHAQNNVVYERGYTQVENVLSPSPEASSAVRYAGAPFNPGTGAAVYHVPVYELTGRHLRIPISLHYQSGGVKVDEIAGVAGLGWTLDAGGVVTRDIVYLPDEYNNWHFYELPSTSDFGPQGALPQSNDNTTWLKKVLWRQKDAQADRYSYNVCGLHGTFILTPEKEVIHLTGDGVLVAFNAADTTFRLTGPDGTRYLMTAKETGSRLNMPEDPSPMTGQPESWTAPTAWHLTQMFSADGMETATFDYASAGTWSRNERIHSWGWEETSQARSLTSEDDSRRGVRMPLNYCR